jgi:thiamine monophosphate kinase
MATRTRKKNGAASGRHFALVMAGLAAAGAANLLRSRTRRKRIAGMVGTLGKSAASVLAASEVLAQAPQLAKFAQSRLSKRPTARARLAAWLGN